MHALQRMREGNHLLHVRVRRLRGLRHLGSRDFLPLRHVQCTMQSTGVLDGALDPMRPTARSELGTILRFAYLASVLAVNAELKGCLSLPTPPPRFLWTR